MRKKFPLIGVFSKKSQKNETSLLILVLLFAFSWPSLNSFGNANLSEDYSDNLVAYWNFDEGIGDILYDRSGNGYDGKIYGAKWVVGIRGEALYFDGVDDYVDIGDVLDFDGDFTISAWVRTSYLEGQMEVVAKGENSWITPGYKLIVAENGNARGSILNSHSKCADVRSGKIVTDNDWHMISFTVLDFGKERTELHLYVDGTLDSEAIYNTLGWDIFNDAHLGIGLSSGA